MDEHQELLDIEQAARFLNVSETSLRRWTNSGRLARLRVGRRRERRFRVADLMAFMEDQPVSERGAQPAPSSAPAAGYVMIRGVPLTHGTDAQSSILAYISETRPSLRGDIAAGRLILSDYAESAVAQLEYWESQLRKAMSSGAYSFRIVGDLRLRAFSAVALLNALKAHKDTFQYPAERLLA